MFTSDSIVGSHGSSIEKVIYGVLLSIPLLYFSADVSITNPCTIRKAIVYLEVFGVGDEFQVAGPIIGMFRTLLLNTELLKVVKAFFEYRSWRVC